MTKLIDQIINELNFSCTGRSGDKIRWNRGNVSINSNGHLVHTEHCTLDDYQGAYLCPMCETILSLYGEICMIEAKYQELMDQKDKRIKELEESVIELDWTIQCWIFLFWIFKMLFCFNNLIKGLYFGVPVSMVPV